MPSIPSSPSLGFDRNDPIVRSFLSEIASLRQSMIDVVETNRGIMAARGVPFAPPVSGRPQLLGPTGEPIPPTQTSDSDGTSASTPNRARAKLGTVSGVLDKVIGALGEAGTPNNSGMEENKEFGATFGAPTGGASRPPSNRAEDPEWIKALRPRTDVPITLPRYGEFNAQDILGLGAQAAAKYSIGKDGDLAGRKFASTVGVAGGVLDMASDVVPYVKALELRTGMGLGMQASYRQNASMGYAKGGISPGAFGVGVNLPFGPAMGESLKEDWQATRIGMGAGISTKEVRELQESLKGQGYSGNDLSRLTQVIASVKSNKNIGNIGSDATTAPIVDQMMRYGTSSVDKLHDSLKGLGEIAIKSSMGVDEVKNSLNEFANDQQKKGATYTQGFDTGKQFMEATGRDARILGQFQDNATVKGMFSAQTGMMPQMMGIAPLGVQQRAIQSSISMMGKAFGHLGVKHIKTPYGVETISEADQRDAMVAQQFGTTPEVIKNMRLHPGREQAGTYLEGMADKYGDAARGIHTAKGGDKSGQFAKLYKGQSGVIGMAGMKKAMHDAGFTTKEIASVDHESPWKRAGKIHEIMQQKGEHKTDKANQTVTVEASPELRRWLRLHAPDDKSAANEGRSSVNVKFSRANPMGPLGAYMGQ